MAVPGRMVLKWICCFGARAYRNVPHEGFEAWEKFVDRVKLGDQNRLIRRIKFHGVGAARVQFTRQFS
ncbi:MAG: hypothetical protein CMJ81_20720 [Planctomycetaceae bacterium]|nr:hypothetical protein [Planctomycetaceae bacterium]